MWGPLPKARLGRIGRVMSYSSGRSQRAGSRLAAPRQMCSTDPLGIGTPWKSMSSVTHRENMGSVGIHRNDSSIAGRRRLRSCRTASSISGRWRSAARVMPICFQVVPDPAMRSRMAKELISASESRCVCPSSSLIFGLDQDADQIILR